LKLNSGKEILYPLNIQWEIGFDRLSQRYLPYPELVEGYFYRTFLRRYEIFIKIENLVDKRIFPDEY
jgi:hypothetical protein